jgi:pimeloyl-ACP methyl ester carboxylesterase
MVLEKVRRRRSSFPSREGAIEHLRKSPGFAGWSASSMHAFTEHGLELRDGALHLRCKPETEAAMLLHIFRVMEQSYAGSQVFEPLTRIDAPVCLASCERSEIVYKPMIAAALELLPSAARRTFATGHCVAQQEPTLFASAVLEFAT